MIAEADALARELGLPPKFVRFNAAGSDWLRVLPDLLASLAERWSLSLGSPFPGIEINYVAPAIRDDNTACVLKVSRYIGETRSEIAALQLWDGDGAARLIAADRDIGALLLERLEPGTMLDSVAESDDTAATLISAGVLRQLWRPAPPQHGLRPLASWCAAYDRNRELLSNGAGGFPAPLFRRADALRHELLISTESPAILHGDLHHFNILRAQRAEWLAIDPKGLVGDRYFDVCQFLRNPYEVPPEVNRKRVDLFCSELGLDRERVRAWCFVHAMLDACWDFEDGGPWHRWVAYAEQALSF